MSEKQMQDNMEEEIKTYIMTNIPKSDMVDKKMEEAYQEVRNMQHQEKTSQKNKTKKSKTLAIAGCAAAVFLVAVTYCIKNPSLAAQLPFIGHIFESLEQNVSYRGNYSENAITLPSETTKTGESASLSAEAKTDPYRAESGDLSITLSEVTYDSNAIYLAILVENKKRFAENAQNNNQLSLNCQTDLYRADGSKETFRPADGNALAYQAEGEFIDSNTFKGMIQLTIPNPDIELDILEYTTCDITFLEIMQELTTGEKVTSILPESNEVVSFTEYDWQSYTGTWTFHLDLSDLQHGKNMKQEISLHQVNEQGFGIETIVKTQYELYAVPIYPAGEESTNYIVTIWDADNQPLDSHGSNAEIRSIYGRDISKITIYILKWEDFVESKGSNSYLQPEKAIFATTVELPE